MSKVSTFTAHFDPTHDSCQKTKSENGSAAIRGALHDGHVTRTVMELLSLWLKLNVNFNQIWRFFID